MKKLRAILLVSAICVPTVVYSDTVTLSFTGTEVIDINVNNLSCKLAGSGAGSVPKGCNYSIGFDENGGVSGTLRAGNSVCTQTKDIALKCQAKVVPNPISLHGCNDGEDANKPLIVSSLLPCDYNGEVTRSGIYRFAWNTFFAMSWPALEQVKDGSNRGRPDVTAKYGERDETPVWDTWRGKRELYRPTEGPAKNVIWNTSSPGKFNAFAAHGGSAEPNPKIPACVGQAPSTMQNIMHSNKIDNFNDETDEIGLAVVWSMKDPVTGKLAHYPNQDSLVRYQVKFNQDHWDYVVDNELYGTVKLRRFLGNVTKHKIGGVSFPMGDNASRTVGSIMTKSAWKMLSKGEVRGGEYYAVDALYYVRINPAEKAICYKTAKFGLIALHMIRKTEKFDTFFFSSFEHKGNYPDKFFYANTNSPSVKGDKQSVPSSIIPSGYQIKYVDPNHSGNSNVPPAVNVATPPYKATRLVPPSDDLLGVNKEADRENRGTIWENYRLVGAQYTPVSGINGVLDPDQNQDFFLSNPVVETNQRFQYFDGGFFKSGVDNVALKPFELAPLVLGENDPNRVQGTVNMGGCMGCHGAGAQLKGTDFSFTLENILTKPGEAFAAETLADKCESIGLLLNNAGSACIP